MSGTIYTDKELLRFLHRAANFTRADFYLEGSIFRRDLGRLCRINYIGPRFQRGGAALIGHSSRGGEKRGEECFAERDRRLLPRMMHSAKAGLHATLPTLWKKKAEIPNSGGFGGRSKELYRGYNVISRK
jgi:hypothetical protein